MIILAFFILSTTMLFAEGKDNLGEIGFDINYLDPDQSLFTFEMSPQVKIGRNSFIEFLIRVDVSAQYIPAELRYCPRLDKEAYDPSYFVYNPNSYLGLNFT